MPASESFKKAYICMKGTRERPFILLVRNLTPYNLHNLLCVCVSHQQHNILYIFIIHMNYIVDARLSDGGKIVQKARGCYRCVL